MLSTIQTAFVYILRSGCSNLFKVGRTNYLERRMKHLATGNPEPLTLFDCIETEDATSAEKYLHHRLRSYRSQRSGAREFFEIDPDELTAIIDDARAFLDDFIPKQREVDELAQQNSDGRVLLPGDAEWERYRALIDVREALDGLELRRRALEADFKLAIGTADGFKGIATWRCQSMTRLDLDSFQTAEPEVYRLFLVEERRRHFRLR
jgi:T5orf172 domain